MKRVILAYLFMCISIVLSERVYAQFNYQEGDYISIDTIANPNYGITLNQFGGIYLFNNKALLYTEIEQTLCYIRGSGWAVYFYNPYTETYNDIRALDIRQSANGEIYDSWTDDRGDLSKLSLLRPVSYYLKGNSDSPESRSATRERHLGFIAQEVEKIVPQAVTADSSGHKYIDYMRILPIAVGSIGTLNNKLEKNKELINQIKKRLEPNNN